MFGHWYAIDAGTYSIRMYDYKSHEMVSERTCIGLHDQKVRKLYEDALEYTYMDSRHYKVLYPIGKNHVAESLSVLVEDLLKKLNSEQSVFKPSFLVALPENAGEPLKDEWIAALSKLQTKEVEFVSTLDFLQNEELSFIIHAGHSQSEIGILYQEYSLLSKVIPFSGSTADENIRKFIANKSGCLISDEDADALKIACSDLLKNKKQGRLTCSGLNKYGQFAQVSVHTTNIFQAILPVLEQIVIWSRQCFDSLDLQAQEKILQNGIYLSGGMAKCYGLKEMLELEFKTKVFTSENCELEVIENMKGWK